MSQLDLTNALAVTVANQDALAIQVANQVIWTRPEVEPEFHSVWYPNEYPYELSVAADVLAIRATGFYIYDEDYALGSKVVGARMWIPEGITASEVHLYLWIDGEPFPGEAPDFDTPAEMITVPITGTGWVSGMFTTKRDIVVNSMIYIGYRFDDATAVWADDEDNPAASEYVKALDGSPIVMSEDSLRRTWARLDQDTNYIFETPRRVFGLDIIVELPETLPSHFWGTYPDSNVTGNSDSLDGGEGVTLATALRANVAGTVSHIRFPVPEGYVGTTATAGLYMLDDLPESGIENQSIEEIIPSEYQATVSLGEWDKDRWMYVELPTPRHVDAGAYMLAAVKFHGEGKPRIYFYGTGDFYFGSDITNSDLTLTAPASGSIPTDQLDGYTVNGRFSAPYATGWPNSIYADRGYFIDVSFWADE